MSDTGFRIESQSAGDLRVFRAMGALVVGGAAVWLFDSAEGGVLYWLLIGLSAVFTLGWIAAAIRRPAKHTLNVEGALLTLDGPSRRAEILLSEATTIELDEERLGVRIHAGNTTLFVPSVFPIALHELHEAIEAAWRASVEKRAAPQNAATVTSRGAPVTSVKRDEHDAADSDAHRDPEDKQVGSHR